MKQVVEKVLEFYFAKMREPTLEELALEEDESLKAPGCSFVTLYLNGEVHGSAGNIKEISPSLAEIGPTVIRWSRTRTYGKMNTPAVTAPA